MHSHSASKPSSSWRHTAVLVAFLRVLRAFLSSRQAAIAPLTALLLVPISGAIAFSVEAGGWQYMQRATQNAADSAAIAAATVNNTGATGTTSLLEARAAAAKNGFVNGAGNTTVTATQLAACPTGTTAGSTCYQATVTTTFPLLFSRVIGYTGDGRLGVAQTIKANAIAITAGGGTQQQVCVLALGPNNSFTSNGGPKPEMSGCVLASNGNMSCNGHDLGADYGVAVGTNSGCGVTQVSNGKKASDPYAALTPNIPPNPCSSYPQEPQKNGDPALPASNVISGTAPSWDGTQKTFCGDVQLSGDVTLTGSNTTVVVENGVLDLNGHTLMTASGAAATVVFSGTNSSSSSHYPTGSGTLNIQAPSSGAWSGLAIYQDPNLTNNVSLTYSGNQPTWDISGAVYLPNANFTFSGAVNKSSNGASCFSLIAYTVLINGTAYIFAGDNACGAAGYPTSSVKSGAGVHERLVQ
jgi:Flp pilus assembly protein TadG